MRKTIKIVPLICGVFMLLSILGGWYGFMGSTFVPASWMKWPSLILSALLCFLILAGSNVFKVARERVSRFKFYYIVFLLPPIIFFVILISLTYTLPSLLCEFVDIGVQYEAQHLITSMDVSCSRVCRCRIKFDELDRMFIPGININKRSFEKIKIGDKVLIIGQKGIMGLKIERILFKPNP